MIKIKILSDEEIRITKAEAVRLSWTHKAHPRYEKDKYLLEAQNDYTIKQFVEWLGLPENRLQPDSDLSLVDRSALQGLEEG